MNRVNLLATDQSSSEVKMTTTGQNHTGSTRTKAAKGLFSHLMFLAGVMLIALLTSGKALAETYTITLSGTGLTLQGGSSTLTQDDGTKTFTLVADEGYKLPEVGDIAVSITGGSPVEYEEEATDPTKWTYSEGTITLGNSVTLTSGITVTANGVVKNITTLKTFTYSLDSKEAVTVNGFTQDEYAETYTVPVQSFTKNVALAGVVTDHSGAEIETTPVDVTIDEQDGTGSATATLKVTAKDGVTANTYTVNFTFNKAKITSVTAPSAQMLANKVSSVEDVIALLPTTVTVITENTDITTLNVAWQCGSFSEVAGAENTFTWTATVPNTLDVNEQTVTGEVTITNVAASTDAKLSALTYSITDGDKDVAVTGFAVEDSEPSQTYNVTLPATTPKDAEITVAATANDKVAEIASEAGLTATLSNNAATITFTVTPESGVSAKRTIIINFTREKSAIVTLSELKYQIADGAPIAVDGFKAEDTDGETYAVTLPFGTSATADITILPVATDENAVITPQEKKIKLSGGSGSITLTVTAENESTTQDIQINFTTAPEQVTEVIVPKKFTLAEENGDNTSEKAIAQLEKMEGVTIKTYGSTEMKLTWEYKNDDNGGQAYADTHGKKNNFRWTVKTAANSDLTAVEGVELTGLVEVTNYIAALIGNREEVTIDANNPYTQIGGNKDVTTVKSITVSTTVDNLAFDNVTVSGAVTVNQTVPSITLTDTKVEGKIDLKESVPSIVLNNATIGEIALADAKETILSLQNGNSIAQITNAGTLTLKDVTEVAALSLAVETKAAALANTGAVKAVVNNGTFTDNTASIVTVTGDASLAITSLPKDQSTTGNKVTLTVTAEATNAPTYQWQKYANGWQNVSQATDATLTIAKVQNGSTQYRCEVKSTNSSKSTTLYTPGVTVRFYTESTPSTPSDPSTPTYTVSLDKVAGATFSKGEKTMVDAGDSFSFKITLDKDYDQSKPVVTVDGKAITADADGSYTIKNIQKDIKIVVTGITKNTATGIEENVADAARAWSEGSTLYIHVPETADVYVVNGTGALQQQLRGVSGDYTMQLRAGFYIVRIGNVSHKVIIR